MDGANAARVLTAMILAPLGGCTSLGAVPASVAAALGPGTLHTLRGGLLEIDAGGAIALVRTPVTEDRVPPRARHAALSIQPGGDSFEVAREQGPLGTGFRWSSRYGGQRRTVLVSDDGWVLHKTWQVPSAEAPRAVLAAAARACPGEVERVEASQGQGPGVDWIVTASGPDGARRQWRGDAAGRGQAFVERALEVLVEIPAR